MFVVAILQFLGIVFGFVFYLFSLFSLIIMSIETKLCQPMYYAILFSGFAADLFCLRSPRGMCGASRRRRVRCSTRRHSPPPRSTMAVPFVRSALVMLLWLLPLVSAQFQFFDQMFGHGQQHQQHRASSASQWAAQADISACSSPSPSSSLLKNASRLVPCNNYLCPDTLTCVRNPADCPCPNVEDEKCLVPDAQEKEAATVVCVRGPDGCKEMQRLTSKWK